MSATTRRFWLGRSAAALLTTQLALTLGCSPTEASEQSAAPGEATHQPADLVIQNGSVYTLNWAEPSVDGVLSAEAPHSKSGWEADAQAIAILNGDVIYVGSVEGAKEYIDPNNTKVVDVKGATILPGVVDSHMHVASLGRTLSQLDLRHATGEADMLEKVVARASELPKGSWIYGQGGDEDRWNKETPDWETLSQRVPDHPVLLYGRHGFVVRANKLAFQHVGIDDKTPQPSGGTITKNKSGKLTGMLLNRGASRLLSGKIPEDTIEDRKRQIELGLAEMATHGFTAVHEAGVSRLSLQALEALDAEGKLPIRVYAMLSGRDADLMYEWAKKGPVLEPTGSLEIRGVKAYYDAALGSRGARMIEDYSDRAGHRGTSGAEYGFDKEPVTAVMKAGFQIAIHAIGDAGNREVLDYFESVIATDESLKNNRHRIEHAQVIHAEDIPRFADLGVIASMEPPHAVEDKRWAEERVGPQRILGAYAWRSLRKLGAKLVFNSDLPDGDHSLFYGLYSAITRQDKAGQPDGGWYPEQRMNAEEALRGYTTWAAYASFTEADRGSLKVGNKGDVTVVNIDPLKLGESNPSALLEGKALMTVVGGKVVYQLDGAF